MATTRTDAEERAELMGRLRGIVSKFTADDYEDAPLADLRRVTEGAEAQRRWYEAAGFTDMAAGG